VPLRTGLIEKWEYQIIPMMKLINREMGISNNSNDETDTAEYDC
jgi:hypothetical protein